ncbi:uncharacterized protein LOC133184026 [Saccostrea echinata]|uniref:uncharacterized protein LOC133184026 n=1 Tax=Saccostrea echinata TaxID=191078 RepID=UPI002A829C70|nr:uncharacterized protein LOC133184026 [Saccostrea echinata]
MSSSGFKKKNSLLEVFSKFLKSFSLPLAKCTPNDVRRFLVWKDSNGKTIVHNLSCPFLRSKTNVECNCPCRLASGTVDCIIQQLIQIFDEQGFGRYWDITGISGTGNPAASPLVKEYLKLIREEQAKAHVLPKQAKPIFLSKVRAIALFIDRELKCDDLHVRERYVLFRDQAWLKLQFFTGDRASDLFLVVAQEVKCLADGSGLVFKHTFGKTLRGDKSKSNSFVIKKCTDPVVCPVKGLLDFVRFAKSHNVDLSKGYLFRTVAECGRVLDKNVSYSVVYERLRYYLSTLGIYEGETPHSFQSGCAITMTLSGSVENVDQVMNHVG